MNILGRYLRYLRNGYDIWMVDSNERRNENFLPSPHRLESLRFRTLGRWRTFWVGASWGHASSAWPGGPSTHLAIALQNDFTKTTKTCARFAKKIHQQCLYIQSAILHISCGALPWGSGNGDSLQPPFANLGMSLPSKSSPLSQCAWLLYEIVNWDLFSTWIDCGVSYWHMMCSIMRVNHNVFLVWHMK